MDKIVRRTATGALALLLLAGSGLAAAADRGRTAAGEPYVMGGIGLDEVQELQQEKDRYNLWVRTAARGSGEYLADVQLLIADDQGRAVFNQPLSGPWLLVHLMPGTYTLYASWQGQKAQPRKVTIPPQGRRDTVFYFDHPG